jgi:hypothetical protein
MDEACGCDAHDIDITSLLVEDAVPAELHPVSYGDDNRDGVDELMVKFPRGPVAALLEPGEQVPVEISGLAAGAYFEATARVRVIDSGHGAPPRSSLGANTPNPFNPTTVIPYRIESPGGPTQITIYDAAGRRVRTLVDGVRTPGAYRATWNGRDEHGRAVASGVYFVRLEASGVTETRKIVLLK